MTALRRVIVDTGGGVDDTSAMGKKVKAAAVWDDHRWVATLADGTTIEARTADELPARIAEATGVKRYQVDLDLDCTQLGQWIENEEFDPITGAARSRNPVQW